MILLLDIDGVLNSKKFRDKWISKYPYKPYDYLLDPDAVSLYKAIINKYKPKIILVSSWRNDYRALQILKDNNITFDTIMPKNYSDRVDYVLNLICHESTQNIILLDDDTKQLPKINKLFLVHTSWKEGLKAKHLKKIDKIMKKGF